MHDTAPDPSAASPDDSPLRRLLHRWFVEFNPLYLLSASLVLGGTILLSRGLAREGSVHGALAVAAIAEVYAASLVGGAAFLTRIGQRRPAVMLALLAVLYQWDLTLHTETTVNLQGVGALAGAAWLALFAAKMAGLAWAMRLRLARSVVAAAGLAAAGLAVLPHVLDRADARTGGAAVALWLAALVVLHRPGAVTSTEPLDPWGQTVLRRAVGATWGISALLVGLHVLFWTLNTRLELAPLVALAPLLAARWIRREAPVWFIAAATLAVVALRLPASFSVTALVAALVLAERARTAWSTPWASRAEGAAPQAPYRAAPAALPAPVVLLASVVPGGRAAALRLATGSAVALYLSAWTLTWRGGPWPAHVLALDLAFAAAVALAVWRARAWIALAPLGLTGLHAVVTARLVPAPRTLTEWGGAAVALGFGLLAASLVASWLIARGARARARARPAPPGT